MPKDKKKRLKPAEERFCQLYAGSSEYFNNATLSYAIAYDYDTTDEKRLGVAKTLGSRLLRKVHILNRCDEILRENLTDDKIDAELAWVAKQKIDLGAKMRAISEYNKLKGRIEEKIKHSGELGINLEEIEKLRKDINELIKSVKSQHSK